MSGFRVEKSPSQSSHVGPLHSRPAQSLDGGCLAGGGGGWPVIWGEIKVLSGRRGYRGQRRAVVKALSICTPVLQMQIPRPREGG